MVDIAIEYASLKSGRSNPAHKKPPKLCKAAGVVLAIKNLTSLDHIQTIAEAPFVVVIPLLTTGEDCHGNSPHDYQGWQQQISPIGIRKGCLPQQKQQNRWFAPARS